MRQADADLLSLWFQAYQLLVVIAVSSMIVTLGITMSAGASFLVDRIFALTNGPHAVFFARDP